MEKSEQERRWERQDLILNSLDILGWTVFTGLMATLAYIFLGF